MGFAPPTPAGRIYLKAYDLTSFLEHVGHLLVGRLCVTVLPHIVFGRTKL